MASVLKLAGSIGVVVVVAFLTAGFAGASHRSAAPRTVLDRTYECTTVAMNGYRVVGLAAWPDGPRNYPPAGAQLTTGSPEQTSLYYFDSVHKNLMPDGSRCRRLTKAPAFSRKGLVSQGTWVAGESGLSLQCVKRWAKVELRVRVELTAGLPRSARIELEARLRRGAKRLASVTWTPRKVTAFAVGACGG